MTDILRSFIVLLNFTIPFELQQLWIFPARFNSLHIQANCWLRGIKFSLRNNLVFDSKSRSRLFTFFGSVFFPKPHNKIFCLQI